MKRRNSLISLKPVKSGLVQEIPRELVVSESGMIWRLVAVSGGTVGERERANKCLCHVKRHCRMLCAHFNVVNINLWRICQFYLLYTTATLQTHTHTHSTHTHTHTCTHTTHSLTLYSDLSHSSIATNNILRPTLIHPTPSLPQISDSQT